MISPIILHMNPQRSIAAVLVTIVGAAVGGAARGQSADGNRPPALLDSMDHTPALRLVDESQGARIVSQSVERGQGRFGAGAERVVLSAPAGSSAALAYEVPPATVINELRVTAWVSCNRPGAQLAAMVVLPRSIDPQTGVARRLLLRSGRLADAGDWQELSIDRLRELLAEQARVARATPGAGDKAGATIDEHEAYLAQIVILAPGGRGATELWVDQIAVHGIISRPPALAAAGAPPGSDVRLGAVPSAPQQAPAITDAKPVKQPAAPRIIQWQGEPLKLLKDAGFDALWMGRLPHEAELDEAAKLGMFLVAPPPSPSALASEAISPKYDRVIAWDLGQLVDAAEIDLAYHWAQAVEQYDPIASRPVLLQPSGLTREASRIADAVVLGRPSIGATQTWVDYAAWLSQQRRAARPGTPTWAMVDTHISPRAIAQLAALRGLPSAVAVPASFNEMSLATTASFGLQPRGFCFTSQASLAGHDADTRMRLLAMELTNLRLGLAEPWLAGGRPAVAAESTQPDLTGLVLKVERSHLLVPLRWSAEPPKAAAPNQPPLSFILPGIPESSDAYLVSISGTERLRAVRVTGGLRITVERLPDDAFVLITEDGYAFSQVERYLRTNAPRAAQARIELAALRRQRAAQAIAYLSPLVVQECGATEELAAVDARLTAVMQTMQRHDYATAYRLAAEAEEILARAEQRLIAATAPVLVDGAAPIPPRWSTLHDCAAVSFALARAAQRPRALPGGDFEDLEQLTQAGWQRIQNPPAGIQATVRLSPEAPASGAYCLELDVQEESPGGAPPTLPTPPVWVTSPPLVVPAGHLVEISGMARMAQPPIGSPDPLLIFDSAGGEESAVRIASSPSWSPFRLVRAAPPGAEVRVTVALGGVGRAHIDGLAYRFIPLNRQDVAQAPR